MRVINTKNGKRQLLLTQKRIAKVVSIITLTAASSYFSALLMPNKKIDCGNNETNSYPECQKGQSGG